MSETGQGAGGGSMGMKHNYSCGLAKMLDFCIRENSARPARYLPSPKVGENGGVPAGAKARSTSGTPVVAVAGRSLLIER